MQQNLIFTFLLLTVFAKAQSPFIQDRFSQKYGIVNPFTNETFGPIEFDKAVAVFKHDTLAVVTQYGKKGVISMTGRVVIPVAYDEIHTAQAGEEHSILAVINDDKRGLWSIKTGKLVLPMEFEFARAIYPDLYAARLKSSEIIEFFNEKGKKQFETTGNTAWPGFDVTCMEIISADKSRRFLDKKGQPFFPEKLKNARWTDGKFVIVARTLENGNVGNNGILTVEGDTVLPVANHSFFPLNAGKFLVTTEPDRQKGLFDAQSRQWLVPVGKWSIYKIGDNSDPNGVIYVSKPGKPEGNYICDATGKILVENCYTANFNYENYKAQAGADYKPFNYFFVYAINDYKKQALYTSDGRPLLPDMAYEKFAYYSERHAIIAWRRHPTRADEFEVNACDNKTGQKLFPETYQDLLFTAEPTRYWAKKDGRWGIVETGRPASAIFEFERVEPNANGTLSAKKGEKWYLYDTRGQRAIERGFDWVLPPHAYQYRKFKANKAGRGKLLALGGDKTKPGGCFALNDRKEAIFIERLYDDPSQDMVDMIGVEEAPPPEVVIKETTPPPAVVSEPSKSEYIYFACDRRAEYPGGEEVMKKFIAQNLQYPAEARKKDIQGRVGVKFVVEKDGSLTNASIEKSLDKDCDAEALRLLQLMPKWKPGQMDNSGVVRVWYSMWVNFKLD